MIGDANNQDPVDATSNGAYQFVYDTYGPFSLDSGSDLSEAGTSRVFWNEVEQVHPGLSKAMGVYVLAVQASKRSGIKPWYVGKTDKQSFRRRFRQHPRLFREVLAKTGTVQIFLIARLTKKAGRFMKSRTISLPSNDTLETMLIGSCFLQNSELINLQKTNKLKGLVVPGFHNSVGRLSKSAAQFGRMIQGERA